MRWVKAIEKPAEDGYYITNEIWVGDDMILPSCRSDTYFSNGLWKDTRKGWEVVEWLDETESPSPSIEELAQKLREANPYEEYYEYPFTAWNECVDKLIELSKELK